MKKKHVMVLIGLVVAVLCTILWRPLHLDEPWYRWRSLSAWLDSYGAGPAGYKPCPEADEALREIGPKAVPYLLRLLRSTNSHSGISVVSRKAAMAAAAQRQRGSFLGTAFVVAPAGSNFNLRVYLANLVDTHAPIRFLRSTAPASWDHWKAYLGFQALGPLGRSAVPDLARLAHDDPNGSSFYPSIRVMTNMVWVAGLADNSSSYVAPGDGAAFHGGSVLRNPKPFLVDGEIAAWSLAAIGEDAVPALMELLDNPSPHLRQRAAQALGLVGSAAEPAVPKLIENLKEPNFEVRQRAADALGWIGQQPELAVPALIGALDDDDVGVKTIASYSLGQFGDRATNAIPVLLKLFAEVDYRTQASAAVALNGIAREVTLREVVPVLLRQLDDPNSGRHNSALIVLFQLHLEPAVTVPHLSTALDDKDHSVRVNAINGLGRYGSAAKAALPKLIVLRSDRDFFVSEEAARALQRIDPAAFPGSQQR